MFQRIIRLFKKNKFNAEQDAPLRPYGAVTTAAVSGYKGQIAIQPTTNTSILSQYMAPTATMASIGKVYIPPTQAKKKLPIFKDEAKRIYSQIKTNKDKKYSVSINITNINQSIGYYCVYLQSHVVSEDSVVYGSVGGFAYGNIPMVSGTTAFGPAAVATKYPNQAIKVFIKYLKELDHNDKLIQRIEIKKNVYIQKIKTKSIELHLNP